MTNTHLISASGAAKCRRKLVKERALCHVTQTHRPGNLAARHIRLRNGTRHRGACRRGIAVLSLVRPGQHLSMLVHDARPMRTGGELSGLLPHRSERAAAPGKNPPPGAMTQFFTVIDAIGAGVKPLLTGQ